MKAIFIGSEIDRRTNEMGLVYGGEYTILMLEPVCGLRRFFTNVQLIAHIKAFGRIYAIPYGSMHAFDRNWRLK